MNKMTLFHIGNVQSNILLFMNIFSTFIKWNIERSEWNFILGPKGTGVCSEGALIMDETTCKEACRALNLPQIAIHGNGKKCYKNDREKCYQDGWEGSGASMICKTSELISGRFRKGNKNPE